MSLAGGSASGGNDRRVSVLRLPGGDGGLNQEALGRGGGRRRGRQWVGSEGQGTGGWGGGRELEEKEEGRSRSPLLGGRRREDPRGRRGGLHNPPIKGSFGPYSSISICFPHFG
jgi:hypothetical protein